MLNNRSEIFAFYNTTKINQKGGGDSMNNNQVSNDIIKKMRLLEPRRFRSIEVY